MKVGKKETENEIILRYIEIKDEIFFLMVHAVISNLFLIVTKYICY